ncbi:MAG TPA: hypothetical protein V6C52_00820 [Coleofasciculaceae cyanobacterium]|jgi:hypothetical protein
MMNSKALHSPVPRRLVPVVVGLAMGLSMSVPAQADFGLLPSLESNQASDITPISELLQDTEPARLQKSPLPAFAASKEEPVTSQEKSGGKESAPREATQREATQKELSAPEAVGVKKSEKPNQSAALNEPKSSAKPVKSVEVEAPAKASIWPVSLMPSDVTSALQPAVDTLKRRVSEGMDVKQNLNMLGFSVRKHDRGVKPISYSPLPAVVVFPVVKHGHERAFGDLPMLFAREYAQRIELRAPETKVYHPIYTVDELRIRGFGHVYDQVMSYYIKAGRPEPTALDYLLKQLTEGGQPVARVIFVEADLDMGQPDAPSGLVERINGWATDGTPKQMRYFVRSRLQVFDAESPEFPMVWGGSWSRPVTTNRFMNVTPSVYADSDSQQAFARVSREMSRELLLVTPREVYMAPQYDVAVQGKVVNGTETSPFPNLAETKSGPSRVSDEHKKAIQRILQRQNSISP